MAKSSALPTGAAETAFGAPTSATPVSLRIELRWVRTICWSPVDDRSIEPAASCNSIVAGGSVVALTALGADDRGGDSATTNTAARRSAVVPVARMRARPLVGVSMSAAVGASSDG